MHSYCTDYSAVMPDITVYMNCDTRLAINLGMFDLSEHDEFIFTIKNYNYIDSSYAFLFRARLSDLDANGEVIFNIDPDTSKHIKPGAFYTFALLLNAFNPSAPTEYKKLTKNGKVVIEYGAHDLALEEPELPKSPVKEVLGARIEPTDDVTTGALNGVVIDVQLEAIEEA